MERFFSRVIVLFGLLVCWNSYSQEPDFWKVIERSELETVTDYLDGGGDPDASIVSPDGNYFPMLKVALIDKGFFNKAGHPARRFLNVLSEIGGRWVTEQDEDSRSLG